MSKKNSRRALLSSAIALLLCVSMLVGSTFAWFTDEVTSTGNIIKSGTLDVEMLWADGTKAVPAEEGWTDASTGAIFNYDKWEPGYTEVRHVKIANVGTLALKYALNIIPTGEVSDLADVIDVYCVDPATQIADRTALKDEDKLGTLTDVLAGMTVYGIGELKAGEELTVTLALKMQETAGNDYQDKSIGSDFAVQLMATQLTYEKDSFGPDYDEDAVATSVVVASEEELVEALAKAENGAVIGIKGNVTWTTGAGIGSTPFVTNAETITLVGVGEDSTFTAIGSGVGGVGKDEGTVIFKNLKIVDKSVSYAENSWEYGYLEFRGNTVFENCDVVNAIMMEGVSAKFVNCTFNSHDDNQYAVWVSDGSASFTGCTFTGARGLKTHEAYGSEVKEIVVDDCVFGPLTKKPGIALGTLNAETTVIIKNSFFAGTQAGDQGNFKYETDTDVTTFNFTDENNVVSTYVDVNSAEELAEKLTGAGAAGSGNTVIRLNSDLDLTGISWTPIKVDGYHGADIVTIDGQNHTITGLSSPLFAGGFAGGSGIVIKNLTITDSEIVSTSTQGSGAFVECVDSMAVITLTNCHLKNSSVFGSRLGGLIGWTAGYNNQNDGPVKTYVTVENCSVVNCELNATGSLGGIIGHSGGNAWTYTVIKDCKVVDCKLNSTDEGGWRVGVVIGTVNVGEQNDISNITESGNTLTQTGKTAPEGQSNLYGRFVPGTTGKLTIDGVAVN